MIEPFKKNEVTSFGKLDRIKKEEEGGAGGMNDAVAKTEAIRNWREQTWHQDKLCADLHTSATAGMTAK